MKAAIDLSTGLVLATHEDWQTIPPDAYPWPVLTLAATIGVGAVVDDPVALAAALADHVRGRTEALRGAALSAHAGKLYAYRAKAIVARRIVDAGESPAPEDVAVLTREAAARGLTVPALAALILTREAAAEAAVGEIDGLEVETLAAIAEAVDGPALAGAVDTFAAEVAALLATIEAGNTTP